MGFRPVYDTYVDVVIEHLGGKSFRGNGRGRTARTPEQSCQTGILEQSQDGVEEGQDNLSRNHPFRRFFHAIQPKEQNLLQLRRRTGNPVCRHCLGADDILNGNSKMIIRFDDNDIFCHRLVRPYDHQCRANPILQERTYRCPVQGQCGSRKLFQASASG